MGDGQRPPALQKLIDAARAAYTEFATDPDAKKSISRIFGAMDAVLATSSRTTQSCRCVHTWRGICVDRRRRALAL